MFEFLIIGAGITGVSVARLLKQRGEHNFVVLEAAQDAGGLCRSSVINGHVLDLSGGHFLCTKYPGVYDFIFSHIPREDFNYFERVSKIRIEDLVIDYPLESNLWQLPVTQQVKFLISVINSGESGEKPAPGNYEQWIRWKLGDLIADEYMLPYNTKLWGVSPSVMDIDWLHKIPRLNIEEIVQSCLQRSSDRAKMPSHAGFYYPRKGGFQEIFDSIYREVQNSVRVGTKVVSLEHNSADKCWLINKEMRARRVVNTAPWNTLYGALGSPKHLASQFSRLQGNSLVVSLWEKELKHDWHWCYCPSMATEYHREFYIPNYAPHSKASGMYTETNANRWPGKGGGWASKGTPLFEYRNSIAYPIPVLGHAAAIADILAFYKVQDLYGVGRWGQWQYLNADVCIQEAMSFVKEVLRES